MWNVAPLFKLIYIVPYLVLLIVGMMLPSDGSHGLLNPKSLAFLAMISGLSIHVMLHQKMRLSEFRLIAFLLFSATFLLIWMMLGLGMEGSVSASVFDQFKIFWLTITVAIGSIYLVRSEIVSFQTVLKTVTYANFAFSFFKISLVALHFLNIIDIWSLLDRVGMRVMSMQMIGSLFRLQLSTDISTPFLLFFFLQAHRFGITWNRFFFWLYLIITPLSVLLSFSRFLLGVAGLAIFFSIWTAQLRTFLKLIPLLSVFIIGSVALIGPVTVLKIVEKRFFSSDSSESDITRKIQIEALLKEHQESPLLGKGLGGYARELIRDDRILHSYEVQWVSFLMQFGVLGLSLILIPVFIIARKILSPPWNKRKLSLFCIYLCWIFSGFTNPFLISLASGILYSLFFLAGEHLHDRYSLSHV